MPLDRSGSYLKIFVDSFIIDYSLPKYNEALDEIRDNILEELATSHTPPITKEEVLKMLENDPDSLYNFSARNTDELNETYNKLDYIVQKYKEKRRKESKILISSDRFDKLSSKDLIVLTEDLSYRERLRESSGSISRFFRDIDTVEYYSNQQGKENSWYKRIANQIKGLRNKTKEKKKEALLIDPIEFFRTVKLTTEESKQDYVDRSQPYLLAIERAKDMGQTALIDSLLSGMFLAKYESILRSEGFDKSISEEQLVSFIKKTKKGVQLSYIKNFSRNIPQEVINIKKKADNLYVFDNYCVLYYDPERKSYSQTADEAIKERKRKADPILFGMIAESKKLYYIADWIDEFCDLTIEEFLKVSGLDNKDIEIPKTIEI